MSIFFLLLNALLCCFYVWASFYIVVSMACFHAVVFMILLYCFISEIPQAGLSRGTIYILKLKINKIHSEQSYCHVVLVFFNPSVVSVLLSHQPMALQPAQEIHTVIAQTVYL